MKKDIQTVAKKLAKVYRQLEADVPNLPLAKSFKDIVRGEGPASAEVMFIGEAPGAEEAIQRRPFVGRSGQLFRSVLEKESGIKPEQIYITNIVKVRPPDNRDPSIEEIAAYKKYLDQEIEILQPSLIVTLGRFSMGKFLPKATITQAHGRLYKVVWEKRVSYVLPIYHPAAALRGTKTKSVFVQDFKKIPKIIKWVKQQLAIEENKNPDDEEKLSSLQKAFAKSDRFVELQASVVENLF